MFFYLYYYIFFPCCLSSFSLHSLLRFFLLFPATLAAFVEAADRVASLPMFNFLVERKQCSRDTVRDSIFKEYKEKKDFFPLFSPKGVCGMFLTASSISMTIRSEETEQGTPTYSEPSSLVYISNKAIPMYFGMTSFPHSDL